MRVIEEFLERTEFLRLRAAVLAPSFPWEPSEVISGADLPAQRNRQLVHGFYLRKPGIRYRSPLLGLLDPVLARLQPRELVKAKLNLTPRQPGHVPYGLHVDTRRPGATTAILYLNTNDGYTLFEDGATVPSVANRLVLFEASRRHTGVSCTDAEFRLVLNINLLASPATDALT